MRDAWRTLMAEAGDGVASGGGAGEAASPWHTSILTAEGRFSPGWVDRLPENLAEHRAMLAQYGDLETLARAHKDSMTAARAKTEGMVRVPGPDARPEETAAWRKALGVPEAPDGYGIRQPEKLPDGVAWDEPLARKFAARAHELGLTPAQVRSLQEFQVGMVGEQVTAARAQALAAIEEEQADLRRTFGGRLDDAVHRAQQVAAAEGLPREIFDPQSAEFWGTQALKFAARMAEKLGEGSLPRGPGVSSLSPELQARDIATNPDNPHYKRYMDRDPEVLAMHMDLMRRAVGG